MAAVPKSPKEPYVCPEPAVFASIVASLETEKEFEELVKYQLTPDEPFDYQRLRLRKSRAKWKAEQIALLGEDGFDKANDGIAKILEALKPRIDAIMNDARKLGATACEARGYDNAVVIRCWKHSEEMRRRSVSFRREMTRHGVPLDWRWELDVKDTIVSYVNRWPYLSSTENIQS